MDYPFDVFLSHNNADKPRVRRLAEQLRAAGLRVWLDEWVIKPGDDIYLAIERGLETSRTLVLCMSPSAFASDWVGLERSTVLFRDPSNAGRRFIPLLLADCKLPDTTVVSVQPDAPKPPPPPAPKRQPAPKQVQQQPRPLPPPQAQYQPPPPPQPQPPPQSGGLFGGIFRQ